MSDAPLRGSYVTSHKRKENDPNYKGESLHEHYDVCSNGPPKRCFPTDIICCILFIGFAVGMMILASTGFKNGNPENIMYPWDVDGKQCGVTADYEDYKYVYFVSPALDSTRFVCVKKCPDGESDSFECKANSKVEADKDECKANLSTDKDKSILAYKTKTIVQTCIPDTAAFSSDVYADAFPDNAQKYVSDIETGWAIELTGILIALIIGYLYLFAMRFATGCMTWAIIAAYHILLIICGVFAYTTAQEDKYKGEDQKSTRQGLEWAAYTCWVFCALTLLYVLCILKRIKIAIAILKAATEFTREYFFVMFIPLIIFAFYLGFLCIWLLGFVYLYSSGEPKSEVTFPYTGIDVDDNLRNCCIYYIIGLIWISEWFTATSFFVIASMACIWYFNRKDTSGCTAATRSLWNSMVHMGSLAFGAAICTIVDILKLILYYLHKMVDKQADPTGSNAAVKCCLKCLICCAECFENFLRYINRNAYIQIALTGKSFCTSAHNGFYLMFRNVNLFAATDGIGMILIMVGKLFIATATTAICYCILEYTDHYSTQIYSPVAPCVLIFIVTYFVAYMLMNIYGVAADSLLQCYCLDSEASKAQGRAKYTPDTLKEFVDCHE